MFTRKHTHQQQFHAFKDIRHSYKASYMQKSSSYHTHTPSEMRTHTSPFRVPKSIKNHNPDTLCPNIRCSYDLEKIMLNWQSRCHCDCFNFIEKVEKPTKRVSWQFACWQSICSNLQSGKKWHHHCKGYLSLGGLFTLQAIPNALSHCAQSQRWHVGFGFQGCGPMAQACQNLHNQIWKLIDALFMRWKTNPSASLSSQKAWIGPNTQLANRLDENWQIQYQQK